MILFPFEAVLLIGATCHLLTAILFLLIRNIPYTKKGLSWWAVSALSASLSNLVLLFSQKLDAHVLGSTLHGHTLIIWASALYLGTTQFLGQKTSSMMTLALAVTLMTALSLLNFFAYSLWDSSTLVAFYCSILGTHFAYRYLRVATLPLTLKAILLLNIGYWIAYPWLNEETFLGTVALLFSGIVLSVVLHMALATLVVMQFKQQLLGSELSALDAATHDALTELNNRFGLAQEFELACARAKRQRSQMALIYIDLDSFKPINDTYGHKIGDLVLSIIAKRIKTLVRASDITARLGGDEFVIILTDLSDNYHAQLESFISRLIDSVTTPIRLEERRLQIGLSLGIAYYPKSGSHLDTLLEIADQGMYADKQSKKNRTMRSNQSAKPIAPEVELVD